MEDEEEGPRSPTATTPSEDHEFDAPPSSPPPAFLFQRPPLLQPATAMAPLYKQRSWSPDAYRDEAWLRRKGNWKNRRSRSVTDEDVNELKACIELGFGFESSPEVEPDQRLSDTLPALELYYAVNKTYNNSLLSRPPAPVTITASSTPPYSSAASDDCESTSSSHGSPHTIFTTGDNPQTVKTRLRQWAQVVACAVRQNSG
ncbi:uncharacterized protein [Arachis hypogaea]|uniref:Uncharacterized protein n=1 Tax=Arachis hypogaea TaxID=3818 RepID=A0A444ZA93_ARAHY|nr:uncharacterized protein LOC112748660 [Arachis hypogaea]QHO10525.1 uncharacterized protein DS421_15g490470 [Arachis hypogaea]RYR11074.1 hypothetical protein Ahy_B05g079559 isoform A [Arachis hypogaea]